MLKEIAVDFDTVLVGSQMNPVRFDINYAITLLQKDNIRSDGCICVRAESIIRQADRTKQLSPLSNIFAHFRILLIHSALGGNESNHSTRAHLIKRFRKEVIVNQKVVAVISLICDLIGTKGHIADCYIKKVFPVCCFKAGNCDIRFGIKQACDTPGYTVQFHTVQAAVLHAFRQKS